MRARFVAAMSINGDEVYLIRHQYKQKYTWTCSTGVQCWQQPWLYKEESLEHLPTINELMIEAWRKHVTATHPQKGRRAALENYLPSGRV